jgi:hypothetical protein
LADFDTGGINVTSVCATRADILSFDDLIDGG